MNDVWITFVTTRIVPAGLMLVMFSIGLTLTLRDFAMAARQPKLVGTGFFMHLFVLPALALLVGFLFQLSPERALGLFIVSLCPAGTTSNAMTFVGRGNVALAVILTALSSIVTVFTIPIVYPMAGATRISVDIRGRVLEPDVMSSSPLHIHAERANVNIAP